MRGPFALPRGTPKIPTQDANDTDRSDSPLAAPTMLTSPTAFLGYKVTIPRP